MDGINGSASQFELGEIPVQTKACGYLTVVSAPVGDVSLPIMVAVGKSHAPVMMVVAGVHGNEYEGQEALRRFFDELCLDTLEGSVVAVPVSNVLAYAGRRRESPDYIDGLNLARTFPGDILGTPTQRLANALCELALKTLTDQDLFVDLHSAESTYNLLPLVGYRLVDQSSRQRSEAAARCLDGFQLWELKHQPGRFNSEIASRGIPSVGTEITGGAGCIEGDVQLYVDALRRLAGFAGVAPYPYSVDLEKRPASMVTVVSPESGFLRTYYERGDSVRTGAIMGEVISPIGEVLGKVEAPAGGLVWGSRRTPMVWAGETCYWIGVEQ